MEDKLQKAFRTLDIPPERKAEIRSCLSSRHREIQREGETMKAAARTIPKTALVILAAVLALAMLVGFAYGERIIELLGGGSLVKGQGYTSMSMGFAADPAEVRSGRVYFVLDGSDRDITVYCTAESYYQHEVTTESGTRQVVVIGGSPDNLGWAEFVWDESGAFAGSNATYHGDEEPAWLDSARRELRSAGEPGMN